eukprot:TRINITY_DN20611_c0_g1_i2.p1 TRINITY_DN20611_c0_g1~~TRINITY_DN20611_c0_g1_i2.p1  ORF type:complete len:1195 (-),score=258.44 TRINITY_DN20611_c0_g1_i2:108-3692(-)
MSYFDADGKTVLYIMYVEKLVLSPDSADLEGSDVVVRWYIDEEHDCSRQFVLAKGEVRCNYCTFFSISFADMANRSRNLTMTLSAPEGDHIGVAFLDLSSFSHDEQFKIEKAELQNSAGIVATVDLHTASQQRWSNDAPIKISTLGFFVDPASDDQAKLLHAHICQETGDEAANAEREKEEARRKAEDERVREEDARKEEAKRKRDEEEEQRKRDAAVAEERRKKEEEGMRKMKEEEEARQRREEEEKEKERKREQEREKEREREQEERRRREDEERIKKDRAADDEIERRHKEGEDRRYREERDSRKRLESEERKERQRRWEEEEEEERRRREEFDRKRKNEFERDRARTPSPAGQAEVEAGHFKEKRKWASQWEEDREKLKRDARRERERELAERERRAEERRRQVEALTSVRLAATSAARSISTGRSVSAGKGDRGGARGSQPGRQKVGTRRQVKQHAREVDLVSESELSEPCAFEGDWTGADREDEEKFDEDDIEAQESFAGRSGSFRWPRVFGAAGGSSSRPSSAGPTKSTAARRPPGAQPISRPTQMHHPPLTDLSLAARLEHLRSKAHINRSGQPAAAAGMEEVMVDSSAGAVPLLESAPLTPLEALRRPVEVGLHSSATGQRSLNNTPRKRAGMMRRGPHEEAAGRRNTASSVLATAMADAATGGISGLGSLPMSAVEESVLRLFVLQRELTTGEEPGRAVLADAAADLAPRMLQVLGAARSVCEANRSKLQAYSEERQLDIDRSEYLQPQLNAIDKLQSQYASLVVPAPLPTTCPNCENVYTADAIFCRRCGQKREGATIDNINRTPGMPRFSPRSQSPSQHFRPTPRSSGTSCAHHNFHYGGGSVASTSPPPTARQYAHGFAEPSFAAHEFRHDRPLDPGGAGPQLPALRAGGSTPPRAKFRQPQPGHAAASQEVALVAGSSYTSVPGQVLLIDGRAGGPGYPQSTPRSEVSSARGMYAAQDGFGTAGSSAASLVPAIPHWDRRTEAAAVTNHDTMWNAIASAATLEPAHAVNSAEWDVAAPAASGLSARGLGRSPREAAVVSRSASSNPHPAPLRSAMQQLRGVADELANGQRPPSARRNRVGGGAHAAAGSPSPEPRPRRDIHGQGTTAAAPEDKYLKILQSLQAKGAVNGGLAAQLLEKQGTKVTRASASRRGVSQQAVSSDSDSSEDSPLRLRGRQRLAT